MCLLLLLLYSVLDHHLIHVTITFMLCCRRVGTKMYLKDIRLGVTSTHNEKCPLYSIHETTTTSWMCNPNFLCVWSLCERFSSQENVSLALSLFPCTHTVCVCMRRKSIIKKNVFSTQLAHSRSFQQCGCIAHHKSSYQEHWTVCVRVLEQVELRKFPFIFSDFLY